MNRALLGNRLKYYRIKRGYLVSDCVKGIGVSKSYYNQLEAGKATPSLGVLVNICNYLDISPDMLLLDQGKPFNVNAVLEYKNKADQDAVVDVLNEILELYK